MLLSFLPIVGLSPVSLPQEEIVDSLHRICDYMPEEVRDTCKTLIDQYTDDIVDMIIADFNATEICMYLKLCGSHSELFSPPQISTSGFNIETNEVWRKYNPRGACHFCQLMERSMSVKGYENKGAVSSIHFLFILFYRRGVHQEVLYAIYN